MFTPVADVMHTHFCLCFIKNALEIEKKNKNAFIAFDCMQSEMAIYKISISLAALYVRSVCSM